MSRVIAASQWHAGYFHLYTRVTLGLSSTPSISTFNTKTEDRRQQAFDMLKSKIPELRTEGHCLLDLSRTSWSTAWSFALHVPY
jgi:hypothetical protein